VTRHRPLGPGDPVHIATLGKGIVREARNGGRYLVEIKGLSMIVEAGQLEPVEPARPARAAKRSIPAARDDDDVDRRRHTPRSLDLHGKTVQEALDALDSFLNDAILDDSPDVRIIHGRGSGRLKSAVQARLAGMRSIRAFRLDPRNPGVTIVTL
jgi:DNA mismatch repair protein MutS2